MQACKVKMVKRKALTAIFNVFYLFLLVTSTSLPTMAQTVVNNPDVLGAERLFSAWMESQIAYRGLPGVAVGVVSDQELVWSRGFGFADVKAKRPMTAETKFRIASNSKIFNAIAIMQLREEGKLRLDDPVANYLPWFKPKAASDDDGPITIEQLLSHSSGLPRDAGDHWFSFNFPSADQIQQQFSERQTAFPPATRWKYSNLGFAIAGMITEKVSGEAWADYVTKNIFKPLNMTETSVDQNVSGLAVGYGRRLPDGSREIFPFVDARAMGSATGVTSNITDLAKFVSAQFRRGPRGGSQIVSGGSWREMLRVRSVEENWLAGSGLGFDVARVGDKTYIGHSGVYPGYTSQTFIQLDQKVGVIVLTNTNDSYPWDIALQLLNTVGQEVGKAANKTESVAWDPAWEKFAGLYRGWWYDRQVVVLDKKLVVIDPTQSTLSASISLEPMGDGRFKLAAPTGNGQVGEVVRFVEEKGKPLRMYLGGSFIDRVQGP